MAINRYDNPQIFQYQSQFVPTELPWDIIQNKADVKKKERDDYKTDVAKLAATPTGLQYINDHYGRTIELPDYKISSEKANAINTKIANLSKKMAGTELNSDLYAEYAELQKEKLAFDNLNSTFDKRAAWYTEETKYRRDQKVNPGDARDIQTQKEIYKMMSPDGINYIPTVNGIQDIIKEPEWINTTLSGIKAETVKNVTSNAGYYNTVEKVEETRKDVLNALTGGFEADQQMQEYVKNMADQQADQWYTNGTIENNDPNALVKLKDGSEISVYEYTKQNYFAKLMQNAEKFIFKDIKQSKSGDTWAQSKIDEKLLASPDLTVKTYNIKGRNILEAATLWGDIKRQSNNADKTILENNTLLATLKAQGGGKIPAGMEDKALEYQNNINQAETTKFNRKLLEDKAWKNIKNTIDAAPIGTSKKEVSAILNSSTSKQDAYAKLKNKYGEEIAKQITFNVDSDIDNKVSQMLVTDNREVNPVQFVYSMASKENQALYKDLVNAATIGQGGLVAFNEDGTEIDSRNLIFDETSGFGSNLDEQGNQIITMRTKPGANWWEQSELVTLKINPETTIGKKIINKTRSNALSNAEYAASVGDKESEKHYLKIADQASHQTTAMETDFNMILQSGNLATIDVALSGLEFNETKDYMYSDGDQKMRFIFTSATTNKDDMNKKFKVSAKIWRNNTWESADEVLKGRKYFDGALNLINTINGQQ